MSKCECGHYHRINGDCDSNTCPCTQYTPAKQDEGECGHSKEFICRDCPEPYTPPAPSEDGEKEFQSLKQEIIDQGKVFPEDKGYWGEADEHYARMIWDRARATPPQDLAKAVEALAHVELSLIEPRHQEIHYRIGRSAVDHVRRTLEALRKATGGE